MKYLFIPLCLLMHHGFGQQLLAELQVKNSVQNLTGAAVGDSLFLICEEYGARPSDHKNNYHWISTSGDTSEISSPMLSGKFICGLLKQSDSLYYYYLEKGRTGAILKAVVQSVITREFGLDTRDFLIPGRILGTSVDTHFNIMVLEGEDHTVKYLRFKGLEKVAEKSFKVFSDFLKNKKSTASFIRDGNMATATQASAPVKIYTAADHLYITMDSPYDEYAIDQRAYKTSVMKLNTASGAQNNFVFQETSRKVFTSAIFAGDLYRMVAIDRGVRLEIFDLENGKKKFSQEFNASPAFEKVITSVRSGNKQIVEQTYGTNLILKSVGVPLLMVDSVNGKVLVAIGMQYEQAPLTVSFIVPDIFLMTALNIVSRFATTELIERRVISAYFHLSGTMTEGFAPTNSIVSRRQAIDAYEARLLQNDVKFKFKGYLHERDKTYAIYQEVKTKTLKVMLFEDK